MRSRPDPARADIVGRRLELLRAEIARDWRDPAADLAQAPMPEAAGAGWWDGHTRVAVPAATPVQAAQPSLEPALPPDLQPARVEVLAPATDPPRVPMPGRHASRRAATLVPEQVRGRIALGPWHLAVIAIGVACALALVCWWVLRGAATAVPAPAAAPAAPLVAVTPVPAGSAGSGGAQPAGVPSAGSMPGSAPSSQASTAGGGAGVTVDVEGTVRHPGVAVLPAGSRVIDAIRAAGGARRRGDLSGLNLAALLTDGEQIVVGTRRAGAAVAPPSSASGGSPSTGPSGPSGSPGSVVDLNTATADQLDTLPGVGPVTAQAILQWRAQNGGFTSIDELMSVDGIGPKSYAEIEPFVTV